MYGHSASKHGRKITQLLIVFMHVMPKFRGAYASVVV